MVYRNVLLLSALCAAPVAVGEPSQTEAVSSSDVSYERLVAQVAEQAQNMAARFEALTDRAQCGDLAQEAAQSLRRIGNIEVNGCDDIVACIQENQTRARQLHEIATSGSATKGEAAIPRIDTNTPHQVLHEICLATQAMIEDAIARLEKTDWEQYLDDTYQTCLDWNLDTAAAVTALGAALGGAYYYRDTLSKCELCNTVKNKATQIGLSLFCLGTRWTRYRTPAEIDKYTPSMLRTTLQAYKQALYTLGFPGNVEKKPVAYNVSTDLPQADEFKRIAESRGYDVDEHRIPGDMIDLKVWNMDCVDSLLVSYPMYFILDQLGQATGLNTMNSWKTAIQRVSK